jgi:hypothetical protein
VSKTILTVCEGSCEVKLVEHLRNLTNLPIAIHSKDGGKHSIKIDEIVNVLKQKPFETHKSLIEKHYLLEGEKNQLHDNVRIFLLHDIEAPKAAHNTKKRDKLCNDYKSKGLFKDSIFFNNIVPIYCYPCLDDIFEKLGYNIDSKHKPHQFEKILKKELKDMESAKLFEDKLRKLFIENKNSTNLHIFINACLELAKLNKIKYNK